MAGDGRHCLLCRWLAYAEMGIDIFVYEPEASAALMRHFGLMSVSGFEVTGRHRYFRAVDSDEVLLLWNVRPTFG